MLIVDEPPEGTDDGENDALAPDGRPLAESDTDCALPEGVAVETGADVPLPAGAGPGPGAAAVEKAVAGGGPPGPNAATPFGVPRPVGPSYPVPAVQR